MVDFRKLQLRQHVEDAAMRRFMAERPDNPQNEDRLIEALSKAWTEYDAYIVTTQVKGG